MKRLLLVITIALLAPMTMEAQQIDKHQKNLVKVNLPPLLWQNYSVQYERVLTKRVSAAVGFRTMPSVTTPYINEIIDLAKIDEPEIIDLLKGANISNWAVTPEARIYLGKKGYGRGLYVAPYVRYSELDIKDVVLTIEEEEEVGGVIQEYSADLSAEGKHKMTSFGVMFGVQWALAKHISLDWWIVGASYGTGIGSLIGTPDHTLNQDEINIFKDDLNEAINELDFFTESELKIESNKVSWDFKSPWGGIRAGISIAIKF